MVTWHPLHEWRRAHSRRMKNLTSSNSSAGEEWRILGEGLTVGLLFLSEGHFFHQLCFFILREDTLTKGCHTLLHGETIVSAPLFPHSPFSEKPILRPPRRCDNP